MKIIITESQLKKLRKSVKIVKFKDLVGKTWSPRAYINIDKGLYPYIKGNGGILVKVENGTPKNTIYLSPEQAKKI